MTLKPMAGAIGRIRSNIDGLRPPGRRLINQS
jgi:hypothetical protein